MARTSTKVLKIARGEPAVAEPSVAEYVVKNRLQTDDEPIHNWYRFVLGYPPQQETCRWPNAINPRGSGGLVPQRRVRLCVPAARRASPGEAQELGTFPTVYTRS
ncbi:MAG: hypothetical protein FJ291_08585 [Planctomycetes bacterium]|nr:hypothetical protein [Planctomycetota bacterium]